MLLTKINEDAIVENLKKRYMDDYIFVSFSLTITSHGQRPVRGKIRYVGGIRSTINVSFNVLVMHLAESLAGLRLHSSQGLAQLVME